MTTSNNNKRRQPDPNGVLIVGGGIAGIRAALDVANHGYQAYLVEDSPSLGGTLTRQDTAHDPADCPICFLGPWMMAADRHPNIRLLTLAELSSLEGDAGAFTATVQVNPRYVKEGMCVGCSDCFDVCPVTVPDELDGGATLRKVIHRTFPQAIPATVAISKRGTPPCTAACPIHQNAQGYIALIAEGRYDDALEVVLRENPLPSICGRLCTHPCTSPCSRGAIEDPINIPGLKRFATDQSTNWKLPVPDQTQPEKIAIIGSGPGGLMCAWELRLRGYRPTIFESAPIPGGMLTLAIPEFRLPRDVLLREIERLTDTGIELRTNTTIGKDITFENLCKTHDAVYIGIGCVLGSRLPIPGADLKGTHAAMEYLLQAARGTPPEVGKRVVVIGGGSVAYDAARTAKRQGAEVTMVVLESSEEMPADPQDVREGAEEDIPVLNRRGPKAIIEKDGRVHALQMLDVERVFDEEGRFAPILTPDTETEIECDSVILAVGQKADLSFLGERHKIEITPRRTIQVNSETLATSRDGVFAGGDVVSGPNVIINAMAAGKKAAISMDRYLRGENLTADREGEGARESRYSVDTSSVAVEHQVPMPTNETSRRVSSFDEVCTGYTTEQAREEAQRCLQCGICCDCEMCVKACQRDAIDHTMPPREETLKVGAVIAAVEDEHGIMISLAKALKIDLSSRQTAALETTRAGIFACGGPVSLDLVPKAMAQASLAVALAVDCLNGAGIKPAASFKEVYPISREQKTSEPGIAWEHDMEVDGDLCRACETCMMVCPFHAFTMTEQNGRRVAQVISLKCRGCGTCTTWCPTGAIHAKHFADDQIGTMLEVALEEMDS